MLKSPFSYFNNRLERLTGLRVQPSADSRLDSIRQKILAETKVSLVVDVGANRGQWARKVRQSNFEGKIISFEPSYVFAELEIEAKGDPNWEVRNIALSDVSGTRKMFIASNQGLSSSLREPSGIVERRPDIVFSPTHEVLLSTLSAELENNSEDYYLKIDTQGSEMNVLKGANSAFDNCVAVEFESALTPMYEGETLHYELCDWLVNNGFEIQQLVITDWDRELRTVALDSIAVRKSVD